MNDTANLISSIITNIEILNEVIEQQTLTLQNRESIVSNLYTVINFTENYSNLSQNLRRYNRVGYATQAASTIQGMFNRRIIKVDGENETLDEDFLLQVEYVREFYNDWLILIAEHVNGFQINENEYYPTNNIERMRKTGIKDSFWVDILEAMDSKAKENQNELIMFLN